MGAAELVSAGGAGGAVQATAGLGALPCGELGTRPTEIVDVATLRRIIKCTEAVWRRQKARLTLHARVAGQICARGRGRVEVTARWWARGHGSIRCTGKAGVGGFTTAPPLRALHVCTVASLSTEGTLGVKVAGWDVPLFSAVEHAIIPAAADRAACARLLLVCVAAQTDAAASHIVGKAPRAWAHVVIIRGTRRLVVSCGSKRGSKRIRRGGGEIKEGKRYARVCFPQRKNAGRKIFVQRVLPVVVDAAVVAAVERSAPHCKSRQFWQMLTLHSHGSCSQMALSVISRQSAGAPHIKNGEKSARQST